ncbi:hypothetical protein EYF80_046002 [Liparis tanakae]|uniref:Uncharacterized protein n=1 Tax=Liparis tanakae TaxID=230148 RepID=A0A4Z2FS96_9TELE|nr:hypothetical protein EYF80_046002 [Liparis tanakae]
MPSKELTLSSVGSHGEDDLRPKRSSRVAWGGAKRRRASPQKVVRRLRVQRYIVEFLPFSLF